MVNVQITPVSISAMKLKTNPTEPMARGVRQSNCSATHTGSPGNTTAATSTKKIASNAFSITIPVRIAGARFDSDEEIRTTLATSPLRLGRSVFPACPIMSTPKVCPNPTSGAMGRRRIHQRTVLKSKLLMTDAADRINQMG